ncbi:retrovirus-related Pol polyprotein from transposon TNT 1-94 [Trichonephila clavipes]|nr:retrovirus-related Pol polyprotein from transposon TNT 1-94 [Trichonephila clavipes]
MDEEFNNLKLRNVWKLTKLPPDKQLLGCRWVYNLKRDENGKVIRYKARLVAQGYSQIKGENYDETFSPVVNFSVIRLFFSLLVVWLKWKHFQCDVTGAYLYVPLNEEVYMKQPQGYIEKGKEGLVCKLKQALYGLHQSGRAWYFELNNVLNEIGLQKLNWCNCTYFFENSIVLLVYVDNIIFGQTDKDIDDVLIKLKGKFNLKIMGKTKRLLGVEFEETDECMLIHQIPYIDEIYKKYEHLNIPISSLPIAKGIQYSKRQCPQSNDEKIEMREIPYRNVLGCLSFHAGRTRSDISYAVNIFSQFQNDPGLDHWYGLLKLFGYVNKTKHYKLRLNCRYIDIVGFSDADFVANRDDRVSMGGQFICLGNAPITWRTFKEKSVSLSTMEAEFMSMVECIKEITWLDNIMNE